MPSIPLHVALTIVEVVISLEAAGVDAGDRGRIVGLVDVAGDADGADHFAFTVAYQLAAAFQEHRAVGELDEVVDEERLLARFLQHMRDDRPIASAANALP